MIGCSGRQSTLMPHDTTRNTASVLGHPHRRHLDSLCARLAGLPIHHDAAVFEDVAIVGVAQRDIGVLLGKQEADTFSLIQVAHDLEDLLDDLRRQAEAAGRALFGRDDLGSLSAETLGAALEDLKTSRVNNRMMISMIQPRAEA